MIGYISDVFLSNVADAIRTKEGTQDLIQVADFPRKILDLPSIVLPFAIDYGEFELNEDLMIAKYDGTELFNNPFVIEHNLGVRPEFFLFWIDKNNLSSNLKINTIDYAYCLKRPQSNMITGDYAYAWSTGIRISNGTTNSTGTDSFIRDIDFVEDSSIVYADDTVIKLADSPPTTSIRREYFLRSGITYKWIAIKL